MSHCAFRKERMKRAGIRRISAEGILKFGKRYIGRRIGYTLFVKIDQWLVISMVLIQTDHFYNLSFFTPRANTSLKMSFRLQSPPTRLSLCLCVSLSMSVSDKCLQKIAPIINQMCF